MRILPGQRLRLLSVGGVRQPYCLVYIVLVVFSIFKVLLVLICPAEDQAPLGAARPPAYTRPNHARPTQQPSVTPAKQFPPTPESASGGEARSRGWFACSNL